jgi:hypothetical protein
MIVSINQPAYLPWLGYFHRIALSDLHIVLDHVQFEKNSFTNRNRIRTAEGQQWLTVPVQTSGKFGELPIAELAIDNTRGWTRKHRDSIRQNYLKAAHYCKHEQFFEAVFSSQWQKLGDITKEITDYLLDKFEIRTPLRFSGAMNVPGRKSELLLNLCREVGANIYLSGPLGRGYLDENSFRGAGVEIIYDNFLHPVYHQLYEPFQSGMAAIDLLFNCGAESRSVLMSTSFKEPKR